LNSAQLKAEYWQLCRTD